MTTGTGRATRRGVLCAAATAVALAGCGRPRPVPPSPRSADREDIERLLRSRSQALLAGDVEALLQGVDPHATTFAAAQAGSAAALTGVGVLEWSTDVLRLRELPASRQRALGAPAVLVDAAVRERLAGEETAVRRAVSLTVVRRDGRWLLAGDSDGPGTPGLWDLGPVRAQRTARALVVAATAAEDLAATVATALDAAAGRVDAAWGTDWPRRTTVLVPATPADAARLLGRGRGAVQPFAALAAGDASTPGSGVRVVVQPAEFGRLSATGRSVVLTHELVHVATRALPVASGTAAPPRWLREGGADQIARSGRGLDPVALARPLLEDVRAGREVVVPVDADFEPPRGAPGTGRGVQVAYAAAWTLCESLARRHSPAALVDLQRTLASPGAPASLPAAVRSVLGEDLDAVVAHWRAEVAAGLEGWR